MTHQAQACSLQEIPLYVELYFVEVLSVFYPCIHGKETFWTLCRNQAHHHLVHNYDGRALA